MGWFWWGRWKYRVTVDFPDGVPMPGKGTADYNCDDYATHRITLAASDSAGVDFMKIEEELIERRLKYGGPSWVPKGGWPAHCERSV